MTAGGVSNGVCVSASVKKMAGTDLGAVSRGNSGKDEFLKNMIRLPS